MNLMALLAFLTVGFLLYLEHKSGELGNTEKVAPVPEA